MSVDKVVSCLLWLVAQKSCISHIHDGSLVSHHERSHKSDIRLASENIILRIIFSTLHPFLGFWKIYTMYIFSISKIHFNTQV